MGVLAKGAPLALGIVLLNGCSTGPQTLYEWDQYQPSVYEYFQGDAADLQAQIAGLEESAQKARAKGRNLPPGFHAHLGLLYARLGREDQVRQQFETEKQLFPESAPFMDFLLREHKGGNK